MQTGDFVENEFLPTLGQAVRFQELVAESDTNWDRQTFGAATGFFCTAAVEAAANGLLQLVDHSVRLRELVDRFPVFEKVDLIAHARGRCFDRGCASVQDFKALIKKRNASVHPKVSSHRISFETREGDEHYARHHVASDFGESGEQSYTVAAKADIAKTVAFLNYVVSDLLSLDQQEAERCLVSIGPTTERRPAYHVDALRTLLRYQAIANQPIRFLLLPQIPGG